jgi:hypothetical protein
VHASASSTIDRTTCVSTAVAVGAARWLAGSTGSLDWSVAG